MWGQAFMVDVAAGASIHWNGAHEKLEHFHSRIVHISSRELKRNDPSLHHTSHKHTVHKRVYDFIEFCRVCLKILKTGASRFWNKMSENLSHRRHRRGPGCFLKCCCTNHVSTVVDKTGLSVEQLADTENTKMRKICMGICHLFVTFAHCLVIAALVTTNQHLKQVVPNCSLSASPQWAKFTCDTESVT